jgi:hypothetical protein
MILTTVNGEFINRHDNEVELERDSWLEDTLHLSMESTL